MDLLLETLELEAGSCHSLQLDLEKAQIGILICSLLKMLLSIGISFVHQRGWSTSGHLQQRRRSTLVLKTLRMLYWEGSYSHGVLGLCPILVELRVLRIGCHFEFFKC